MMHWKKSQGKDKSLCGYYELHKGTDCIMVMPQDGTAARDIMNDPHFCRVCKSIWEGMLEETVDRLAMIDAFGIDGQG